MSTANRLVELVKRHEGLRLKAYYCPAGKCTIGYGHTATAKPGMAITEEVAELLLMRDLVLASESVDDMVTVPLTLNQFYALTSFVFNLGAKKAAKSTLVRKLNAGDYAGAAKEFARWVHAIDPKTNRLIKLPGLVKRRAEETSLFLEDRDEKDSSDIVSFG